MVTYLGERKADSKRRGTDALLAKLEEIELGRQRPQKGGRLEMFVAANKLQRPAGERMTDYIDSPR